MAQNSNHFCLEFNFCSNFEPSQSFRTKKSEPTQSLDTWSRFRGENREKLNGSNFEPSQSYACMESREIASSDDFLSHLKDPRVFSTSGLDLKTGNWNFPENPTIIPCNIFLEISYFPGTETFPNWFWIISDASRLSKKPKLQLIGRAVARKFFWSHLKWTPSYLYSSIACNDPLFCGF